MKKLTGEESKKAQKSAFNIQDYLRVLWRKKYFLLLPIFVSGLVAVVGIHFLSPLYLSSTIIRMEDQSVLTTDVEKFVQQQDRRRFQDQETLARIRAEFSSSALLDELISRLGMDQDPVLRSDVAMLIKETGVSVPIEELVYRKLRARLSKKFQIDSAGPAMFRISCFDADPDVAYVLADAVTNILIERKAKSQMEGLREASQFSEEQLAVYKSRLEKSEGELGKLRLQINQTKVESGPVGDQNFQYASTALKQLDISIDDTRGVIQRLDDRLKSLSIRVSPSLLASDRDVRESVANLEARSETELLKELESQGQSSAELTAINSDVEEGKRKVQRTLAAAVDRSYPGTSADYRPLVVEYLFQNVELQIVQSKRSHLDDYLRTYRNQSEVAARLERDIKSLQEEVESNRSLYSAFLRAKTSTQIGEAAQSTNLGVTLELVERPVRSLTPVKPEKIRILILALFLGGMLGLSALVYTEFADTSFRTVADVENRLGLKVLGTVPRSEGRGQWNPKGRRKQMLIWASTSVLVLVLSVIGFYYYGKAIANQSVTLQQVERPESH
jgi:succinoglycan biosynthesis transport protein ExoP